MSAHGRCSECGAVPPADDADTPAAHDGWLRLELSRDDAGTIVRLMSAWQCSLECHRAVLSKMLLEARTATGRIDELWRPPAL